MPNSSAQLVVLLDSSTYDTIDLPSGGLTIGRAPDNGLALPHPLVSAHHAELRLEPAQTVLLDLGSASGTLISGSRIPPQQPHILADGATFQIGPFMLIYRVAAASAASAEAPPSSLPAIEPGSPSLAPVPIEVPPPIPPAPPRPTFPLPLAAGVVSRYLYDLPPVYHNNNFLGRYLQIFETIWEPMEQREDHIQMYFDPRTCPASFLPWLAQWLDLTLDPRLPEARQRSMLSEVVEIYQWRGTRFGLERMIEVCTGLSIDISEDPAQPFVFHVQVTAPDTGRIDRQLLEDLIQTHKPAHVGYVLELRQTGAR